MYTQRLQLAVCNCSVYNWYNNENYIPGILIKQSGLI